MELADGDIEDIEDLYLDFADGAGSGRQPQHQDAVPHQRRQPQRQQLLAGREVTMQARWQRLRWQPGG